MDSYGLAQDYGSRNEDKMISVETTRASHAFQVSVEIPLIHSVLLKSNKTAETATGIVVTDPIHGNCPEIICRLLHWHAHGHAGADNEGGKEAI